MKFNFDTLKTKFPKEKDILGRKRYFNSAVLIPIIEIENQHHLLFQVRSPNIRQGSEICFPGGEFDPLQDENFSVTAVRETCEELGIESSNIEIFGQLNTFVAHMGAIIEPFIGYLHISDLKNLKINKNEVESVFTMPIEFFINNKPDEYKVRIDIQPSYINDDGEKITLLPAKELGLPKLYHQTWGKRENRIILYKTDYGNIWGITAELVQEAVKILVSP